METPGLVHDCFLASRIARKVSLYIFRKVKRNHGPDLSLSSPKSIFQKKLGKANVSAINRSLGFLLGVAKGFALICITIFITKTFLNETEYPSWLRTSKSLPLIESTTMFVASQLPMYLRKNFEQKPIESFKTETKMKFESLNLPKLKQGYSHEDTVYNEKQRLLMDKEFRKIKPSQQKLQ